MARNTWLNFLNWSFGHEQRWPAGIELEEELPRGAWRSWVSVQDGKELRVSVAGRDAVLRMANPADKREVRRWLKECPRPMVQRLEFSDPTDDDPQGELVFIRTAMPAQVVGPVPIHVPMEVVELLDGDWTSLTKKWPATWHSPLLASSCCWCPPPCCSTRLTMPVWPRSRST